MTKRNVLLLGVLGVALVLIAGSQTWVRGTVADAVLANTKVSVTGSKAAPALVASALVAAAGLLAAMTTGRIARIVSAVVAALAGVATVVSSALVVANPSGSVRGQAAALTGHTGDVAVRGSLTAWPWVGLGSAVLLTVAGLAAVLAQRRWSGLSASYEAPGRAARQTVSDWDRLSQGEDPTVDSRADLTE